MIPQSIVCLTGVLAFLVTFTLAALQGREGRLGSTLAMISGDLERIDPQRYQRRNWDGDWSLHYSRADDGTWRFWRGGGVDPWTGARLLPAGPAVREAWERDAGLGPRSHAKRILPKQPAGGFGFRPKEEFIPQPVVRKPRTTPAREKSLPDPSSSAVPPESVDPPAALGQATSRPAPQVVWKPVCPVSEPAKRARPIPVPEPPRPRRAEPVMHDVRERARSRVEELRRRAGLR